MELNRQLQMEKEHSFHRNLSFKDNLKMVIPTVMGLLKPKVEFLSEISLMGNPVGNAWKGQAKDCLLVSY